MIFGDEWKCDTIVTPYEIKELGLWNDTKTPSLISLKSLDSNVMSRPRRPLPVYFRKRNIFPFFLFQLSVYTLTTFSGTTNRGFRKRSTELRFWKQRLTALMYWRAKNGEFQTMMSYTISRAVRMLFKGCYFTSVSSCGQAKEIRGRVFLWKRRYKSPFSENIPILVNWPKRSANLY